MGEPVEEAVVREVREETGLKVGVLRLLGYADGIERDEEQRVRYHHVMLYFEVAAQGGELRAGDDAAAAEWVRLDEIAARQVTDAVGRCLTWAGLAK